MENTVFVMKTYFASHRYLDGFLSSQTSARIENFRARGHLVILNGSFCVKLLAEYFTK
jgi:hypothetical protein